MRTSKITVILLCLIALHPLTLRAGTLDAIEDKIDPPASSESSASSYNDDSSDRHSRRRRGGHHGYGHGGYYGGSNSTDDAFGFLTAILLGGLFSNLGGGGDWAENHATLKQDWYPGLPTARLEGAYHSLGTDVQAYNLNATVGYMGFGLDCDFLHAFEKTPATQMKFISPHALLRATPARWMQIDLAVGAKVIRGSRTHSGFEAGLPLYFLLGKHAVLDVKPYYSRVGAGDILDLSVGISGKWKMLGARAAYRWIDVDGAKIHGPQGGLFVQW